MHTNPYIRAVICLIPLAFGGAAPLYPQSSGSTAFNVSVYDRTRVDSWQWFAAPPEANTYGYVESLLRVGIAQRLHRWDWQLELAQPSILAAPSDAISPVTAQGQLGLGASYYAANNNSNAASAFLKQGFARLNGEDSNLRLGRFEFIDGQETKPQTALSPGFRPTALRIGSSAILVFPMRSEATMGSMPITRRVPGTWWQWQRADQGVFNMNGNPELNVDVQYLALTRADAKQHILWRAFAIGYHDGRTGLTKTDNRALAVRSADHKNIRIGTYGGDLLASVPAGPGQFDFLFWGAGQKRQLGIAESQGRCSSCGRRLPVQQGAHSAVATQQMVSVYWRQERDGRRPQHILSGAAYASNLCASSVLQPYELYRRVRPVHR